MLNKEAEIDLRINDFAWDAEALSLTLDDLNASDPHLVTLTVSALPKDGDSIEISYGDKRGNLFSSGAKLIKIQATFKSLLVRVLPALPPTLPIQSKRKISVFPLYLRDRVFLPFPRIHFVCLSLFPLLSLRPRLWFFRMQ